MCDCVDSDYDCTRFSSPMPLIGIYIVGASTVCSLAMAADVTRGIFNRRLWFPNRFFTLNAASLTLLAVVVKLPMDLSSPMPGSADQLAKLSSTVFMSTAIANFMPSLGTMSNKEILANMAALNILVITLIVNIYIEFSTGVIYFLTQEGIIVVVLTIILLVTMSFSALTIPTTKKQLEIKYHEMHKLILSESKEITGKSMAKKLEEDVKKYRMMAETANPQFVIARSATCIACCIICCLNGITLFQAWFRVLFMAYEYGAFDSDLLLQSNYRIYAYDRYFFLHQSDYGNTTYYIAWFQCVGMAIGMIAPTLRWFTAIKLKCSKERGNNYKAMFKTENYWIERLEDWKERPFGLGIRVQKCRKFIHATKNIVLDFSIKTQIVVVAMSKLIQLLSIFIIRSLLSCCKYFIGFWKKIRGNTSSNGSQPESKPEHSSKLDLSPYVLHLEGEEELPQWIMTRSDPTDRLIEKGRKLKHKGLKELLQKSTTDFKGVAAFDDYQVPSLDSEKLPNCWSLPVVTLTSILMSLPHVENRIVQQLVCSVHKGLVYVNLIEEILDTKGGSSKVRDAAERVWIDVELYCKWLNEDLHKLSNEGESSKETLKKLAEKAENYVMQFKNNRNQEEHPLSWPAKIIAANSMYRITKNILLDYESGKEQTNEELFQNLYVMIADILGACFTNLPQAITMKCFCRIPEKRDDSVREAAILLGETEEILEILQQHELPSLDLHKNVNVDEWRASIRQKNSTGVYSSNNFRGTSVSSELHIDIEQ